MGKYACHCDDGSGYAEDPRARLSHAARRKEALKCRDGDHRFKPFPRSRDLFCEYCGEVRCAADVQPPLVREVTRAPAEQPLPGFEQRPPPPSPEVEQARDQIGEHNAAMDQALNTVAERIAQMCDAEGLPADQAEEIIGMALEFGEDIDLAVIADRIKMTAAQLTRNLDGAATAIMAEE